jgi:4-hydroxy-3-polyprenylbenzoate decarboxylase
MKIKDLTDEQLVAIADNHPNWMARNRPEWMADNYPVFHLTAITHRQSPVYSATLVGRPPMEDCYLAKATERLFLPMLRAVFPEITDYWLPWEGVFHNIVIVAIEKAYPGHAQKIMSGLWGQGQMSFCKMIVVVDHTVDPKNPQSVLKALADHLDTENDLTITKGVLDVLDHSAPQPNFGHKLGVDLTARVPGEPQRQTVTVASKSFGNRDIARLRDEVTDVGTCLELLPQLTQEGQSRHRILALTVQKAEKRGGKEIAEALFKSDRLTPFSVVLLYDEGIDLTDPSLILWKLFNNVDPARDLYIQGKQVFVDACKKGPMDGHTREWPEDLTFDV